MKESTHLLTIYPWDDLFKTYSSYEMPKSEDIFIKCPYGWSSHTDKLLPKNRIIEGKQINSTSWQIRLGTARITISDEIICRKVALKVDEHIISTTGSIVQTLIKGD